MPTTFGDGLLLAWADDVPTAVEPFVLGSVGATAVEPFDVQGPLASATSVEPFWMYGAAGATAVEPFDFGAVAGKTVSEPFDILAGTDIVLPPVDLGDGESVAADAAPIYGYWVPDVNELEDLGVVTE